ncbi:hypothetical protein MLAC_14250 [Mycobacterium lacus]|uniref:Uncharacterized protein n=1 Tax=Mycobacterium lacus TaxID=169765 RepID=A0A7I7NKB1_9MYCO|nr:hypothetical protein MLAC_14250 [Mycobacterium lacus]
MPDDWGGWSPHAKERRAARASMTPLQRIEWLEQALLAWGHQRLARERAKRQAIVEAAWSEGGHGSPDDY